MGGEILILGGRSRSWRGSLPEQNRRPDSQAQEEGPLHESREVPKKKKETKTAMHEVKGEKTINEAWEQRCRQRQCSIIPVGRKERNSEGGACEERGRHVPRGERTKRGADRAKNYEGKRV